MIDTKDTVDTKDTIGVWITAGDYGKKKETMHRTKHATQDKSKKCRICKKMVTMEFWYHGELIKLCKLHYNEWQRSSAKIEKVNWTDGNGKPLKTKPKGV